MAHYEPPHQDLRCLQIQLFSSLALKELSMLLDLLGLSLEILNICSPFTGCSTSDPCPANQTCNEDSGECEAGEYVYNKRIRLGVSYFTVHSVQLCL